MDVRSALKEQLHAGLAMLRECIEKCPDDLWLEGKHPRTFWRIAFHAAFFTHFGLGQTYQTFASPPESLAVVSREEGHRLWTDPLYLEPYEMPEDVEPYSRQDILDYISFVDSLIDSTINNVDLDTDDSGIPGYEGISKLSHELMNLRHLQGHVGQLSELLMARDIDIEWVYKA